MSHKCSHLKIVALICVEDIKKKFPFLNYNYGYEDSDGRELL